MQETPCGDMPAVAVDAARLGAFMQQLRDEAALRFDLLITHTAVDWPEAGKFEIIYILYSSEFGWRLMVSSMIPREAPVAPTVSHLWTIALWQEREVYDLFGILYDNHPDLRRLFLEDDWQGHPLRKDYQDEYMLPRPV